MLQYLDITTSIPISSI